MHLFVCMNIYVYAVYIHHPHFYLLKRINVSVAEARRGHFIVPTLYCTTKTTHNIGFGRLLRVPARVGILSHIGSIALFPILIMAKGTLISPTLSDCSYLFIPHHLLHVTCRRLIAISL